MLIVPLQAVPSQVAAIALGSQNCEIKVYQKFYGVFLDLYVSNVLIVGGVLCENLNRIVRSAYLGFTGDLMFIDNQGSSDPKYDGLGSRFSLVYLEASDLAAAGLTA